MTTTTAQNLDTLRRDFAELMRKANLAARMGRTTEARAFQRQAKALQPAMRRAYRAEMSA